MKNKIITFLCIIALLVLGAISKLVPVKCAELGNTLFDFDRETFYVFGLDKVDADRMGENSTWPITTLVIENSADYGGSVIIYIDLKLEDSNNEQYSVIVDVRDSYDYSKIETYTYNIGYDDDVRNHFLVVYNYYNRVNPTTTRTAYVYFGTVSNDINTFMEEIQVGDVLEFNYYTTSSNPHLYLQIRQSTYNYLINNFCAVIGTQPGVSPTKSEIMQKLTDDINYFYSESPYFGKIIVAYRNGINEGQLQPISQDWVGNIMEHITNFLNIQILPGLTFGTLLAVPLVLCLLRLILFVWRNEG